MRNVIMVDGLLSGSEFPTLEERVKNNVRGKEKKKKKKMEGC